jgi:restriction system protein
MPKNPRTWVVRAGKNASAIDDFRTNSLVAIGWHEAGPIDAATADEELTELFDRTFPTAKPAGRRVWQAQVKRFLTEIQPGDHVATYDPNSRLICSAPLRGSPLGAMAPCREFASSGGHTRRHATY